MFGQQGLERTCNVPRRRQNRRDEYQMLLKGLGHAILGNFSTDRMVIELTKISKYLLKTIEDL